VHEKGGKQEKPEVTTKESDKVKADDTDPTALTWKNS